MIDASIGVKWFSRRDESDLAQSDRLLETLQRGGLTLLVPDLFFYEIANALANKSSLATETVDLCVGSLWDLGLRVTAVDQAILLKSAALARRARITIYDASYCVLAAMTDTTLVTANPRHQGKAQQLGCKVIPLSEWETGVSSQ